jgi:heterodisulfide reductase subunit B
MKLAYYPGCFVRSSGKEYDQSLRTVCSALNVELEELGDWNCCGATHVSDEFIATALSARNMTLTDLPIVTGCSICYSKLREAAMNLAKNDVRSKVNKVLTREYTGAEVRNILDVLIEAFESKDLSETITRPLAGWKVAPYYGCLLTRPSGGIDSAENPSIMERFIEMLGADPIDFNLKMRCCGGTIFISENEAALEMSLLILSAAKSAGADLIVVACPLCHIMLDAKQRSLETKYDETIGIPVLYITQLAGIALGLGAEELGLALNSVSPMALLKRLEEESAEG